MTDEKHITKVTVMLTVKNWEFAFPMSAGRDECWQFACQWAKFLKDPKTRMLDCDVAGVRLFGTFSSGDFPIQDGIVTTTSKIVKVEKISLPEKRSLLDWFKSWLYWPKRIDQIFRLTTEKGSQFSVKLQDAAKEACNQLQAARFGAPDEIIYRRYFDL